MNAAALHIAYIAAAALAALIVHRLPIFDLRSLKRRAKTDEEAASPLDLFERPDLGAILNLLVLLGAALAVLIGWRIPAEVERIYGAGASFGILFPAVEMTTLGRAAQVIGAAAFGLIALRLLRILVIFAAAGVACLAGAGALDYIFQIGWLF